MPTEKQKLGQLGESLIVRYCSCPRCKRTKTLRPLVQNFKCADVICDFCGFISQVKACTVLDTNKLPKRLLGAAWGPQKARMDSGIYLPLFIVLVCGRKFSIYYLPTDFQKSEMFIMRKELSATARRAGWQGFYYDLTRLPAGAISKIYEQI